MKKLSTNIKFIGLAVLCVFVLTFSAAAQKKRSTRSKKTVAAKPNAAANAAAIAAGEQRVSDQIKTLSRFIYLLGSSTTLIKAVDEDAKKGKLSQSAIQQSEAGKKGLILTIVTFKNALLKLEDDFRANPALRPYLLQLTGVGELAETAEQQARANNFDQAGRTMLEVLNQLTDTLQAMP